MRQNVIDCKKLLGCWNQCSFIKFISNRKKEYKSFDSVLKVDDAVQSSIELLNFQIPSGFWPYKFNFKIRESIMFLRDLCPSKLYNDTRLRVTGLQKNLIKATIITGGALETSLFSFFACPCYFQTIHFNLKEYNFLLKYILQWQLISHEGSCY